VLGADVFAAQADGLTLREVEHLPGGGVVVSAAVCVAIVLIRFTRAPSRCSSVRLSREEESKSNGGSDNRGSKALPRLPQDVLVVVVADCQRFSWGWTQLSSAQAWFGFVRSGIGPTEEGWPKFAASRLLFVLIVEAACSSGDAGVRRSQLRRSLTAPSETCTVAVTCPGSRRRCMTRFGLPDLAPGIAPPRCGQPIVENRWPGSTFDSLLADQGFAVWHVMETPGHLLCRPTAGERRTSHMARAGRGPGA
jgi:hypothetical protein